MAWQDPLVPAQKQSFLCFQIWPSTLLSTDSWPQHKLQAAAQEEHRKNELRELSGFSGGLLLPKAVSPVFMGRDSTASLGRYGPVKSFPSMLAVKHSSQ